MDMEKATPQEISDYKRSWADDSYNVQVDMDSDIWGKDWCRKNIERWEWSFDKFSRPDDSHTFKFEYELDAKNFLEDYSRHNPRFKG
jgi:hypothetical protein